MSLIRPILLTLFVISAPLAAQGRRGPQGGYPRYEEFRSRDIEELGPARLIAERSKELALDKPQLGKLEEMRKAFDADAKRWANDIKRMHRVLLSRPPMIQPRSDAKPETAKDSVKRARRDSTDRATLDAYSESQAKARRELGETMLKIRAAYDSTATATVAILTETQRLYMNPLLESASNELTFRLREANIR